MSQLYTLNVDCSAVAPFVAKVERLLESVREVFGEGASVEIGFDAKITDREGELVVEPLCTGLEVTR